MQEYLWTERHGVTLMAPDSTLEINGLFIRALIALKQWETHIDENCKAPQPPGTVLCSLWGTGWKYELELKGLDKTCQDVMEIFLEIFWQSKVLLLIVKSMILL